jgi:anaerobic selenocysteine-containing dehydrogenase
MHMYHSWGSRNVWLRQITSSNRLFIARQTASAYGIGDDDWVWIESHHSRVKAQVRLIDGVNPQTVWTWNAIGKRRGAWGLKADAPEGEKGFLLNHAISELLPVGADGQRRSNSDPVTGQAAWFDLRVRLRKCAPGEEAVAEPQFPRLPPPPETPAPPAVLSWGADFRRRRKERR